MADGDADGDSDGDADGDADGEADDSRTGWRVPACRVQGESWG